MKTEIMFHCGNAPKMERVIELTVALARNDLSLIKENVRQDFVWKIKGEDESTSLNDLTLVFDKWPTTSKLTVVNALSHGNGAMCEGELLLEDGKLVYFCNVVQFVNTAKDALVKEAHTYFIDHQQK